MFLGNSTRKIMLRKFVLFEDATYGLLLKYEICFKLREKLRCLTYYPVNAKINIDL
jgi:hypothetical protein